MKLKYVTVIFAAFLLLVGCQGYTNKDTQEGKGDRSIFERTSNKDTTINDGTNDRNNNRNITKKTQDNEGTGFRDDMADRNRHSNNRSSNNTQDEYDISKKAADRIVEEVEDIDQAYVLTTKNNAYVAATLDENNTTPNDHLAKNDRNHNSTGTNVRNTNDRNVRDRTVNEGDANRRGTDNHIANRRDVEGHEVTDDVKSRVAEIVQDVDNDIDNVYVSTSPDFFDLADNYATDMDDGKPVRGFFDQIGNMVERIFPQNKR